MKNQCAGHDQYILETGVTDLNIDSYMSTVSRYTSKFKEVHYMLGITTEVIEFIRHKGRDNQWEEMGDCLWYLFRMVSWFRDTGDSVNLDYCTNREEFAQYDPGVLLQCAGDIADQYKRFLFYGKFDKLVVINCIEAIYVQLLVFTKDAMYCDMEQACEYMTWVMNANIAKLRARYGEKFDQDRTINRNPEHEALAAKHWIDLLKSTELANRGVEIAGQGC